jgi:FkbM family methyltransferase
METGHSAIRASHYLGDNRVLTESRHGVRMLLDTRDIILTPIALLYGEWEPGTTAVLREHLKPGMHFVDVGASVGWFSCLASNLVGPDGYVSAFEADPETSRLLADNLALNWRFRNARVVNAVAYSMAGEVTLYRREKYQGNSSIGSIGKQRLDEMGDAETPVVVTAARLDDHLVDRPIDLMKIDVEGAEAFVLEGAQAVISRSPNLRMLVEWSPEQMIEAGRCPADLMTLLNGWNKSVIGHDGKLHQTSDEALLGATSAVMLSLTRA